MDHEELLQVLRNGWEDIERTKQRQWRDFYYALIAQGAVLSFFHVFDPSQPWLHCVFAITITILSALAITMVWEGQTTLFRQRDRIDDFYKMLHHSDLKEILQKDKPQRWQYPVLYSIVIAGAGVFAVIVILSRLSLP